jgi:hypothetical protein
MVHLTSTVARGVGGKTTVAERPRMARSNAKGLRPSRRWQLREMLA